ncbi:hypothetical protein VWY69_00310 [Phaeobacter sp. A90a-4k]|uniref:hypothetical protein n=1 Tax=Phaeobacter sp. A90a-4k TaxID=3112434 RepID=UPI003A860C0C
MFRAVDSGAFGREFETLSVALDWIEQNDAEIDWPQNWPILTAEVLSPSSAAAARATSAMKDWVEVYEIPDEQPTVNVGSTSAIEVIRSELELVALAGAIPRKPNLRVIQ